MDKLVEGLGPAFAAGFAVQQFLEILGLVIEKHKSEEKTKKMMLALVSLIVGLGISWGGNINVLETLGKPGLGIFDLFVTGLIISAGTEGFNSIMKFLGYSKEKEKAEAAIAKKDAGAPAMENMA